MNSLDQGKETLCDQSNADEGPKAELSPAKTRIQDWRQS
jgi:hypothetical protein